MIRLRLLDVINLIEVKLDVVIIPKLDSLSTLVDFRRLRKLPVGLEVSGLVCAILQNHIGPLILEITETDQDNITPGNPNALAHLATNSTQPLDPVKTECLQAAASQHG